MDPIEQAIKIWNKRCREGAIRNDDSRKRKGYQ